MEQKKKTKWLTVGSVMNPHPNSQSKKAYIKLGPYNAQDLAKALSSPKGVSLTLKTRDEQIASLEKAMAEGKMPEDKGAKLIEGLMRYKDAVKYDLILKLEG